MAENKTKAKAETEAEVQKRRDAIAWERVPYYERKPDGIAREETHFVVEHNGKIYRYAYNTQLMIPRCIRDILESKAAMQNRADERAAALAMNEQGGVNLGTY